MKFGNAKQVDMLDGQDIKVTDNGTIMKCKLWQNGNLLMFNDDNAKLSIKNAGYLFDVPVKLQGSVVSIDFNDSNLQKLPVGDYQFELVIHTPDGTQQIYPDDGFVPLSINSNVKEVSGEIIKQITIGSVIADIKQDTLSATKSYVDSKINDMNVTNGKDGLSAYQLAVKNGFKGDLGDWLNSLKPSGGVPKQNIINDTKLLSFETDKAHYQPGERVNFKAVPSSNYGTVKVNYYRRNEPRGSLYLAYDNQSIEWHWQLPNDDNEAYIVELVNTVNGQSQSHYIAVNVSQNANDRPIMGFLSKYGDYNVANMEDTVKFLRRLHINYIQYYDWFDRHDVPMNISDGSFASQFWLDFAKRPTRFDIIHKYIELANQFGMLSMAYGLINGSSQNQLQNGLTKQMYMYDDNSGSLDKVTNTDLRPWAKNVLYQTNYMDEVYQDIVTQRMAQIYNYLPFDGWHIDTLGNPGDKYKSDGTMVNGDFWKIAYPYFINKAIKNSNGKRAGLNAVAEYGQSEVAKQSNADYIYTEVWDNRKTYNDLFNMITEMRNMSGKELIVAAYMHHHWSNNSSNPSSTFNTPAVVLTDLVIMASGATHLEMGEHMLTTEYFPNNKLSMDDELKEYLVKIYDFMVAFKRLLKLKDKAKTDLVSSSHQIFNNFLKQGNISVVGKEDQYYRMDFLLNLSGLNGEMWRDDDKNRNEPTTQYGVWVGYTDVKTNGYKHFYTVSIEEPIPVEVFPNADGMVKIPKIDYGLMLYATKF
ncbi:glycoside hydrolase family 66 protein [Convivina intestini]|uniref:glycoside hydrolase family 66 protein n=1 Tax=Convivina intestini TaxID=1505726 RepID=UPI00200F06C3|nr:glycoside hydrolase family 66 protein [Convivina intestini]CAH1857584.1 hypothetical protein R077811_01609 [Convivina intestini]